MNFKSVVLATVSAESKMLNLMRRVATTRIIKYPQTAPKIKPPVELKKLITGSFAAKFNSRTRIEKTNNKISKYMINVMLYVTFSETTLDNEEIAFSTEETASFLKFSIAVVIASLDNPNLDKVDDISEVFVSSVMAEVSEEFCASGSKTCVMYGWTNVDEIYGVVHFVSIPENVIERTNTRTPEIIFTKPRLRPKRANAIKSTNTIISDSMKKGKLTFCKLFQLQYKFTVQEDLPSYYRLKELSRLL